MYKKKVYPISEARKELCSIVSDASVSPTIIGKRGKPSAVIIDYDVAIKYIPKEYFETKKPKKINALALYAKQELERLKKHPIPKHLQDNLSERVDEILYGK